MEAKHFLFIVLLLFIAGLVTLLCSKSKHSSNNGSGGIYKEPDKGGERENQTT